MTTYEIQKQDFIHKITECVSRYENGWDDAEAIFSLIIPTIGFIVQKENDAAELASRFGGDPMVPDDFSWPEVYGHSMAFYFQFNMQELSPFDNDNRLPDEGLLLCFVEANSAMYEYHDPKKRHSHVYFFPNTSSLQAASVPQNLKSEFVRKASLIQFGYSFDIAEWNHPIRHSVNLSDDDVDFLEQIRDDIWSQSLLGRERRKLSEVPSNCVDRIFGNSNHPEHQASWAKLYYEDEYECNEMVAGSLDEHFVNLATIRMSYDMGSGFELRDDDVCLAISKEDLEARHFEATMVMVTAS